MNILERAKNILITPNSEWLVVDMEVATPSFILMNYVFPFAFIASAGKILTGLIAPTFPGNYLIWVAVVGFISIIIGFYISVYVIDMLAPGFDSEKDSGKSAQLVAYSNTPVWVTGLLTFIPIFGVLFAIAGWVYSIYLFYNGLGILKKSPKDKKVVYMVMAYIVMVAISLIVSAVLMAIFGSITGLGAMGQAMLGR